jgi:hypothetical protein
MARYRFVIATATIVVERAISTLMGAAAMGGLAATLVAWPTRDVPGWTWLSAAASVPRNLALVFLPAAIAFFWLMPSTARIARSGWPDERHDVSPLMLLPMGLLTGLTVLQIPPLVRWWTDNVTLVQQLSMSGRIPSASLRSRAPSCFRYRSYQRRRCCPSA